MNTSPQHLTSIVHKLTGSLPRVGSRFKLLSVLSLAAVLAALAFIPHAKAATLCVNTTGAGGCFTSIQAAIDAAAPGDTINVAAGTYAEQIEITKALTLLGPNANINPNTGARVAEAVIVPTTSDPLNPSFAGPTVVTFGQTVGNTFTGTSGVTFRGFTVDGDNPALTSGVVFNGADVDAEFGIYGTETANPDAVISNNIVKNIGEIAVWINSNGQGGAKNANSRITTNKVDNVLGAFGQAIRISDDAWLDVTENVVTRSRLGIVVENYSGNTTTHPASVIADNNVTTFRIGIRHNLHYVYTAPGFTITRNTVQAYVQSVLPPQVAQATAYQGIRVESIQQTVFVNVTDNTLTGNRAALSAAGYTRDEGLMLTNSSNTSPNILFRVNYVADFLRGAFNETPAVPTFECNSFVGNTTGVYLSTDATNGLVAHTNNIAGNGFGMQNDGPATVNAQGNWWGAANGPGPVGPGSGDRVSTGVDFSNWLTATANCPPPCPTNVARASYGATATASSQYNASYPASGVIDGEHDGNNWGAGGGWNDATRGVYPDSVQVNFNVVQTIDTIDVYTLKNDLNSGSTVGDSTTFSSYGNTAFDVQYWDGSVWVTVPGGSVTGNNRVKRRFSFATPVSTDRVRVLVNDSADHLFSRVVEIEAFSCAPVVVPTPTPTPTPTPPCTTNVARATHGSTVVASSQYNANYAASGAIDGEHDGNNWGAGGGWNDATRGVFPDNIQVNFNVTQTIREIHVYTLKNDLNSGSTVNDTTPATSYGNTSFNVQYWTGSAWADVPGGAVVGNTLAKRKFIFSDITTDKIRVLVNDSADHLFSRVVEIEAFSCNPAFISCVNTTGAGGCFTSIQAAINAANPGDGINVAPGTYNENLTLPKRLTLRGAQAGVPACGRSASESIVTAGSGTLLTLQTGSAGAVIDGFTFSGGARGIQSTSGPIDNLQILNNRIIGFTGNGVFLNDPGADITVNQNSIDGSSKVGGGALFHLDTDAFNGFHLTNNCVANGFNTATGFFVDGNRNVGASATRTPLISGNVFNNLNTGTNLGVRSIDNGTISGNTWSNNNSDGLQGGPRNTLITANTFSNNGRNGLSLTAFGNPTTDATRGAQLCTITCNTMTGNGFTNNMSGTAGGGITFSANQAPGTISSNHVNFNNISGNFVGARYTGTETIDAENNWWGSATGPTVASNPGGTGDVIADTNGVVDYTPFLTSASVCAPPPPAMNIRRVGRR